MIPSRVAPLSSTPGWFDHPAACRKVSQTGEAVRI
jgi:hypothetical protein